MNWRTNLTKEQLEFIDQSAIARRALRAATLNTPACINCEDADRASVVGDPVFCYCANGELLKKQCEAESKQIAAEEAALAERRAKACTRCGGTGSFGRHGECFRCAGKGIDPKFMKRRTA